MTLSGTDSNDSGAVTFANRAPIGSYHWVAGPDVAPGFLPMILTGTSTYTIDGYTLPTDHTNVEGTLNTATTTLSYNFGTQSASAHIDATVNSRHWIADASNVMMHGEGGFSAYTGNHLNEQNLTLTMTYGANTYTSTAMTAWGSLNGSLFGPSLAGAGLTYAFNAADNSSVNGAVTYTGPAQSAVPFKGVLMAIGDTGAPGTYKEEFKTWVDGGFSAVGRVTGTDLDGHYPVTFNQSCGGGNLHQRPRHPGHLQQRLNNGRPWLRWHHRHHLGTMGLSHRLQPNNRGQPRRPPHSSALHHLARAERAGGAAHHRHCHLRVCWRHLAH